MTDGARSAFFVVACPLGFLADGLNAGVDGENEKLSCSTSREAGAVVGWAAIRGTPHPVLKDFKDASYRPEFPVQRNRLGVRRQVRAARSHIRLIGSTAPTSPPITTKWPEDEAMFFAGNPEGFGYNGLPSPGRPE